MLTRRQFLKIGAATTVAAASGSTLFSKLFTNEIHASEIDRSVDRIVPTFCEICFWKCGMLAYVKNGRVVQMTGNPAHPLSNGKLCPRGTSAPGIIHDPDRLKKPLIRVSKKDGEQEFREATWEEALDLIAEKLQPIMDQHGPDKIALFSHGHGGGLFEQLLHAMGSHTATHPSSAQCRAPRDTGFVLTFGDGVGNPEVVDVPNSRAIALIGSHLGENMHNSAVQDISDAIGKGATIITVDPRYSTMAGKSDYWLPIKPGTDIALVLAWIHVLLNEDIYQQKFIARNAMGLDQLRAHVKEKTPEWAYIITGIEPDVIRRTARILAGNAPHSLVHPGRHVVWYGDDTQRSRAIAILNALLGNWGVPGGFYFASSFPLSHPPAPKPEGAKAYAMPANLTYPLGHGLPSQDVVKASIPGTEGIADGQQIRAWIVYGCNVPLTLPDPAKTHEALQKLDFVVAIDILPAEITGYADVVLPECTFLERYGTLDARPYRKPFVALRQPAVDPMYDSRPGWWMVQQLARRLKRNGATLERYFPWKDMEDHLKSIAAASHISFDELKKKGVVTMEPPSIYATSDTQRFSTPSGKIELYSATLASIGQPPIPEYTPHEEPPPGYFRLLFGRSPVHSFSRTTNNAMSLEIFPENEVWINTEMARVLDLKNGVYVTLKNQDGVVSDRVKVRVTERIRQDCVYMVHGFGRTDPRLTKGYRRGASDTQMITRYKTDPLMGGTGMNVNFVTLERSL